MARGITERPGRTDLEEFRRYLESMGAVFEDPLQKSSEILRFRIGRSLGVVATRQSGRITSAGASRAMLNRFLEHRRFDNSVWVNQHRQHIASRVGIVTDRETLERIAVLIGYEAHMGGDPT